MKLFLAVCFSMLAASSSAVELNLPTVFSDHMVLQREMPVPIWGKADAGATIQVSFAGQILRTQASNTGAWRLKLSPLNASAEPRVLAITAKLGDEKIEHKIQDVLVGEVWLAGGQSNMYRPFRMLVGDANQTAHQPIVDYLRNEAATANDPLLRQFRSGPVYSVDDPQFKGRGTWSKAVPGAINEFSGTAYFFARELRRELKMPVAFLSCNLGGTLIEAWMPRQTFHNTPKLKEYYRTQLSKHHKAIEAWDEALQRSNYKKALEAWKKRKSEGMTFGRQPRKPVAPQSDKRVPCTLYNGIIHPVATYGIRGFLWYQGESNSGHFPEEYGNRLIALADGWRKAWGRDELHFFWCQLASYKSATDQPVGNEDAYALVKDGQRLALKLPHTGMAVLNDVGDSTDVHPKNKVDAGKRLSLWALNKAYEKGDVVFSGPLYKKADVDNGKVIISFDHANGGLMSGRKHLMDPVVEVDAPPQRFQICGDDGRWVWGRAKISGPDTVTVWHPEIKHPAEVRYAWSANADDANLYNRAGLPASMFKTPNLHPKEGDETGESNCFGFSGNDPIGLRKWLHFDPQRSYTLSAHRGGAQTGYPENCIATFEHSLAHGCTMLEIDPRLTKDGAIVLHHDKTLDRTTSGTGPLSDQTLAELQRLTLTDLNGQPTSYKMPTLQETIAWARNRTVLVVDQKDVPLEQRISAITENKAEGFVMLIISNLKQAQQVYASNPNITMEIMVPDLKRVKAIDESNLPWQNLVAFVGHQPPYNRDLIHAIHERGAMCMAGTSRNLDLELATAIQSTNRLTESYRNLLDLGIDIIETDLPNQVHDALQSN